MTIHAAVAPTVKPTATTTAAGTKEERVKTSDDAFNN